MLGAFWLFSWNIFISPNWYVLSYEGAVLIARYYLRSISFPVQVIGLWLGIFALLEIVPFNVEGIPVVGRVSEQAAKGVLGVLEIYVVVEILG